MDLLRLWYVDEEYLNSLYNQIYENISEITISEEKASDNEGDFGTSITDIINKLGFPLGLSLRYRYSLRKHIIKERKVTPSIESKISELQEYIKEKRNLKELIRFDCNSNGIIWISDMFKLLELYCQGNKNNDLRHNLNFIENPSDLVWHFHWSITVDNSKRNYEDSSELTKEVCVEMFAGGEKIKRNVKHITTAIEKLHLFDFSVIGDLHKINNCTYTIKPIVIYQDDANF